MWLYILYICRKFQIEYHKNLCQTTATCSTLLKCDSDIFFPNYQATGSLRNDKQSDSIPPWKASFMICPKWRAYCSRAKFKINTVINIISARWQTKKIFQLTQLWKSINESSFICKDLKFSPFCRIEIKEHAL